jgi:outer membrane protein assembly factor BamB
VASLVYNGELLYMTCGFPDLYMQAIDPTGTGNVTRTHVRWQRTRDCSYVPSPISFGPYFLVVSDRGVATCLEAATGTPVWRERLGGGHSASLVSAGGLVYFQADKGITTVVKPGPTFTVVARNELEERTFASPAISSERLYLRSEQHLFCFRAGAQDRP